MILSLDTKKTEDYQVTTETSSLKKLSKGI